MWVEFGLWVCDGCCFVVLCVGVFMGLICLFGIGLGWVLLGLIWFWGEFGFDYWNGVV